MTKYEMQYGFNGENTIRFLKDTNIDKNIIIDIISFTYDNNTAIDNSLIKIKGLIKSRSTLSRCIFG